MCYIQFARPVCAASTVEPRGDFSLHWATERLLLAATVFGCLISGDQNALGICQRNAVCSLATPIAISASRARRRSENR